MSDEGADAAQFLGVLNTEYFVLQGASNASISESSSRSSLYLVTLSSALVSLGFVSGASPDLFLPFAAAALTTVFVLGWFTIARLIDTAIENLRALRGMARIRRYYAGVHPAAPPFFVSAGDDASDAYDMLGMRSSRRWVVGTMASMVGAVNAVVGGSGVAIFLGAAGAATAICFAMGVIVGAILFAVSAALQIQRFNRAFPSG
ncbi:hypothetical protein [Leifsonia xyli]|uniref:hypothetical protein n=1 Tax=Leifsonia xyli TaxID=1575 RepID=UPI000AC0B41E